MTALSESFFQRRADEIRNLAGVTAQNVWRIGQILTKVKAALPHGGFLPWIEFEFQWSDKTAQNFMNVYERFKFETVSNLTVGLRALYVLASSKTPEPVVEDAIARAEKGEKVTAEGAQALKESYAETGKASVEKLTEMVEKRRCQKKRAKAKPAKTYDDLPESEDEEPLNAEAEKQLLQEMKENSERNARFFAVIGAIECLHNPPLPISEIVRNIQRFDTPDKDWAQQVAGAIHMLERLERELNGTTTAGNPGGNSGSVGRYRFRPSASGDRVA
jgi:hypothetical protein